jgi:hypothetical protein
MCVYVMAVWVSERVCVCAAEMPYTLRCSCPFMAELCCLNNVLLPSERQGGDASPATLLQINTARLIVCHCISHSTQIIKQQEKEELRRKTNSRKLDWFWGKFQEQKQRRRTRFASARGGKNNRYLIAHSPQKIHVCIFFPRQRSR